MHIQAYSKPYVTLGYLEPWYIQKLDIFRTTGIFTTLAYSKPQYIENAGILKTRTLSNIYDEVFCEKVNSYHYFRKL